jgi:hypothetical protein
MLNCGILVPKILLLFPAWVSHTHFLHYTSLSMQDKEMYVSVYYISIYILQALKINFRLPIEK